MAALAACLALTQLGGATAAPQIAFVKEVGSITRASYTYYNTLAIPVTSGVAKGDTVIITAGTSTSSMAATSASDSRGNSYHVDAVKSNSGTSTNTDIISGYVVTPLVSGDTITVNFNNSAALLSALATEWSGIASTGALDRAATNQGNTTSLTSSAITTTQPGDLLIGSFAGSDNATFAPGTGFTAFTTQLKATVGSTYRPQWQEYQIAASGGSYTATGTDSKANAYAGAIAAYRAGSDGQPPTAPGNLTQSGSTDMSISLSWSASTDNVGVAGYSVYNGTSLIATTTNTVFTWKNLSCGMVYALGVDAYDAAGNHSAQSPLVVSTSSCDDQPPTVPANLTATGTTVNSISISWDASTDNVGVAGYGLYLDGQAAGNATRTSFTFNNLFCGTDYTLGVDAYDALNNRSDTTSLNVRTDTCDLVAPTVSITAPTEGSLVSGSTTLSADASDNAAVASVQFQVDGVNTGSPATALPYQTTWDSKQVANGPHVITALATDTAGNAAVSANVDITTSNDLAPPSVSITSPGSGALLSGPSVTLSASASDDIGVVGVQLKLDGSNLGPELTASP
ncbi:MAG: Ig-like domain-containing protein, partial [Ktedonobacterales bacterium]